MGAQYRNIPSLIEAWIKGEVENFYMDSTCIRNGKFYSYQTLIGVRKVLEANDNRVIILLDGQPRRSITMKHKNLIIQKATELNIKIVKPLDINKLI